MHRGKELKVCFMGGNQAGLIGLLTVLVSGCKVESVVGYSPEIFSMFKKRDIPFYDTIKAPGFRDALSKSDILLSVHGREIVGNDLLSLTRLGGINCHPYLSKYKGVNPVGKALENGDFEASVGIHIMNEKIDSGKVLREEFLDISGANSIEEAYNRLYPCYASVILQVFSELMESGGEIGEE